MLAIQRLSKFFAQAHMQSFNTRKKQFPSFYCLSTMNFGRLVPVTLSDLGEGTKEAEIKKWHLKIGDMVEEEDRLVEVGTDKLVADIPSPVKGIVRKIHFDATQICLVGKALCEIETEDGESTGTPIDLEQDLPFEKSKQ